MYVALVIILWFAFEVMLKLIIVLYVNYLLRCIKIHFLKSKSMMATDLKASRHAVTPHRHLVAELSHSRGESLRKAKTELGIGYRSVIPCLRVWPVIWPRLTTWTLRQPLQLSGQQILDCAVPGGLGSLEIPSNSYIPGLLVS